MNTPGELRKRLQANEAGNVIDLEALTERLGGNWVVIEHLIYKFQSIFKDADKGIELEIRKGDLIEAQKMVHKLKGVAANLSFIALYRGCVELEQTLKVANQEEALNRYPLFTQCLYEVIEMIQEPGNEE